MAIDPALKKRFVEAIQSDKMEDFQSVLMESPDAHWWVLDDENGNLAIHVLAGNDRMAMLYALLDAGADVNAKGTSAASCVHGVLRFD